MKYVREKMLLNDNLYNKLNNMCIFSNLKLEVVNGIIFKINNTNINFIEPHRFIIKINDLVLVVLCYDNLNLYLYNKETPINVPILRELIDSIKGGVYNG